VASGSALISIAVEWSCDAVKADPEAGYLMIREALGRMDPGARAFYVTRAIEALAETGFRFPREPDEDDAL
jgi:hypothetical protein